MMLQTRLKTNTSHSSAASKRSGSPHSSRPQLTGAMTTFRVGWTRCEPFRSIGGPFRRQAGPTGLRTRENAVARIDPAIIEQALDNDVLGPAQPPPS